MKLFKTNTQIEPTALSNMFPALIETMQNLQGMKITELAFSRHHDDEIKDTISFTWHSAVNNTIHELQLDSYHTHGDVDRQSITVFVDGTECMTVANDGTEQTINDQAVVIKSAIYKVFAMSHNGDDSYMSHECTAVILLECEAVDIDV